MQYLKDIGFVVRRTNTRDADRFITLFTQQNGKIDVLAKGVRKLTSRRAPSIELLNKISFQAVKSGRNPSDQAPYVLAEVELIESASKVKDTFSQMKKIFLLSELICLLCPIGQKQASIYDLIGETLKCMENKDGNLFDFEVKLLTHLGYWDATKNFLGEDDLTRFIEQIAERRLRTPVLL